MIVVTGGAGFIGSHLVDELVKRNLETCVIDDLSNGKKINIQHNLKKIKFIISDISTNEFPKKFKVKIKDKIDYIFHLACHPRQKSFMNPQRDIEVNIKSMVNILEIARMTDSKVIFTSNSGIYGEPKYLPIDENHPDNPSTPYDLDKLTAEHYLKLYNKTYGIKFVICRLATVYGERQRTSKDWKPVIAEFAYKILNNKRPIIYGDGNQTRDFIYVTDVVNGLILSSISKRAENNIFILSTNTETSINNLFSLILKMTSKKILPIYAPPMVGDIRRMRYSNEKAKKTFGFQPKVRIEDGIKKYLEWLKTVL